MLSLLWTIIVILSTLWIIGLGLNWSGWMLALFVVVVVLLIYNVFVGRRVA